MKIETTANKIEKELSNLNGVVRISTLVGKLNKLFKRPKVKFTSKTHDLGFLSKGDDVIIVSGSYDYCKGEIDLIRVELYCTNASFLMSENQKANLIRKITTTIIHENRHKHHAKVKRTYSFKQYKVKKKASKEKLATLQYYANPDEIDAYAHETKVDFHFGKLDINMLRSMNKINMNSSESIFAYKRYFRKSDPKIWNKFLKKVYKNINESSQII